MTSDVSIAPKMKPPMAINSRTLRVQRREATKDIMTVRSSDTKRRRRKLRSARNARMAPSIFFKKSVKTAVTDDGNPPGALVLTKLVEWYRFGVGDEKSFFVVFGIVVGKN